MMAKSEFDKKQQEIDGRIDKTRREEEKKVLAQNRLQSVSDLKTKQQNQRKKWGGLLSDSRIFLRKQLVEAAFTKKTPEALVYLGFKVNGAGEGKEKLFTSRGDKDAGISMANVRLTLMFPSDSSREEWRVGLSPQLLELSEAKGKRR